MAQIWLTYEELAALIGCDRATARAAAIAVRLHRRKSRDGETRAKLTPSLTEAFFDRVLARRLDLETTAYAGDLRTMHQRMAAPATALPDLRNATVG